MKNLKIKALVFCGIVMALGVARADENRQFEAQVALERTPTVIVCRSKRCQAAGKAMSKQFLYNTLSSLLKANQNKKVALCEANPYTHVCLNDEIIFGADVGSANIQIALPSLSLIDVKKMSSDLTSEFIADYD